MIKIIIPVHLGQIDTESLNERLNQIRKNESKVIKVHFLTSYLIPSDTVLTQVIKVQDQHKIHALSFLNEIKSKLNVKETRKTRFFLEAKIGTFSNVVLNTLRKSDYDYVLISTNDHLKALELQPHTKIINIQPT